MGLTHTRRRQIKEPEITERNLVRRNSQKSHRDAARNPKKANLGEEPADTALLSNTGAHCSGCFQTVLLRAQGVPEEPQEPPWRTKSHPYLYYILASIYSSSETEWGVVAKTDFEL